MGPVMRPLSLLPASLSPLTPLVLAVACALASASAQNPGDLSGPPMVSMLRDSFVVADGTGGYWLTGTAGTFDKSGNVDFDYNRGAPLFRSADGKAWEPVGYAWDRVEQFERTGGRPSIGIWMDWSAPAGEIDGLLAQATTAPRLIEHKDAWYLLCAMNQQNIIVQKSTGAGPEGPYEDHAYLVTRGSHPSFFKDPDGTLYLLFGEGWLAPVNDDLTALTEPPRLLTISGDDAAQRRLTIGDEGVALFLADGRYHALAPRWTVREGKPSHDAFLWSSDAPFGPYSESGAHLPDTGPVTVFQNADGQWMAVSSQPTGESGPEILPVPQPN